MFRIYNCPCPRPASRWESVTHNTITMWSVRARRRQDQEPESASSERKVKQLLVSDPYDDIEGAQRDTGDKVGTDTDSIVSVKCIGLELRLGLHVSIYTSLVSNLSGTDWDLRLGRVFLKVAGL